MLENVEDFEEISKKTDKLVAKYDNKRKGYGPRCKVCNHDKRDDIEELRELGYSFNKIIVELGLEGVISEMSLSRHFENHYPNSKKYKEKLALLEEKAILEAIEYYPPIKPYFLEDHDNFSETFFNDYGFCTLNHDLCIIIPEKTILYPEEVLSKLEDKINSFDKHDINNRFKFMEHVVRCQNCQLMNTQTNYNLLFEIIINKLFNNDINFEKDLIPLIVDEDYDKEAIAKELVKKVNSE